ncbi:MAG: hypothetical protein BWY43_00504 [candidate division WS2 bacterium ADurb.Bin280]|uniref:Uncharacterized protein n=1 Tax=candidate division WS2 bacterium ADurb.Bin280 TaxID=1852829 RepID=A0A1V5SD79_9BACT|nr:MAG: hypothetical protein BWY43_00504 [candidate division WS2 bacterium ADurb.Bin280]
MKAICVVLCLLVVGVSNGEEADVLSVRAVLASPTSTTVIICADRMVDSGRYDLHFRLGDARAVIPYFPLTLSGDRERRKFEQDGYLKMPCRVLPVGRQSFAIRPVQLRHADRLWLFGEALSSSIESGGGFGFELSNARVLEVFEAP